MSDPIHVAVAVKVHGNVNDHVKDHDAFSFGPHRLWRLDLVSPTDYIAKEVDHRAILGPVVRRSSRVAPRALRGLRIDFLRLTTPLWSS